MIASQIINQIISSVKPDQTAETAGLTGTFEQLGNAIGVAPVGTVMLSTPTTDMTQQINASDVFSQEDKTFLIEAAEDGVQLVSNAELDASLDEITADPEKQEEYIAIYHLARTDAFKAGWPAGLRRGIRLHLCALVAKTEAGQRRGRGHMRCKTRTQSG